MNRLTINNHTPGDCVHCGGIGRIQVDASDFGIIGVFPCSCQNEQPIREFLAPLTDYLKGSVAPPEVIA